MRRAWLAVAGGVLAAGGVVAFVVVVTAQQPSPPRLEGDGGPQPVGVPATETPAVTPSLPSRASRSSPGTPAKVLSLPRSEPVRITIPTLRVSSPLEQLELDPSGAMQVPRDPGKAGWFSPSPAPGMVGSSVIAGHVTWNKTPAVFFGLAKLRAGNTIEIQRQDGRVAVFTVDRIGRFAKDQFPTDEVYGSADHAVLRLITCGGQYDATNHRYLDNIIVWAHLTGTTVAHHE